MNSNRSRYIACGLLAVGLSIAAALATPGIASADSSTDPFSWIGGMDLGDLSVPAQTSTSDMQVSIDGMDLFPTEGNTAIATSGMGDIAIAIGNDANASATGGLFDTAIADGTNSFAAVPSVGEQPDESQGNGDFAAAFGANTDAQAGAHDGTPGNDDVALVFDPSGTPGSDAFAGEGNFDLAAVFGAGQATDGDGNFDLAAAFDGLNADILGGSFLVDIGAGVVY